MSVCNSVYPLATVLVFLSKDKAKTLHYANVRKFFEIQNTHDKGRWLLSVKGTKVMFFVGVWEFCYFCGVV